MNKKDTSTPGRAGKDTRMTMTVSEQADELEAAEVASARREYRTLLMRDKSPRPGDAVKLREAMKAAGFSSADKADDLKALDDAANITASLTDPREIARLATAAADASAACDAGQCDILKSMVDAMQPHTRDALFIYMAQSSPACDVGELQAQFRKLHSDAIDAYGKHHTADSARKASLDSLASIRRAHPRVFDAVE